MGIAVAACGTVLASYVWAGALIYVFFAAPSLRHYGTRNYRFDLSKIRSLLRIGIPNGAIDIVDVLFWNIALVIFIGSFGTAHMAAAAVLFNLRLTVLIPCDGLGVALTTLVPAEVRAHARLCILDAIGIALASTTFDFAHRAATAMTALASETGAETLATACDVTDAAQLDDWLQRTVDRWGKVDALLVNAGGPHAAYFKEITDEQWQAAFELTLLSSVRMIRMVIPHMRDGGAILTVTSSSVKEPIVRLGLSTVMRAGVVVLVKTLADELAKDGIRVNNLVPGRIDTDRVAQLDQGVADQRGITFEEARAAAVSKIPLGRLGTIDDFGQAGAYLLSPAAGYITGATLRVDGGLMRSV